MTLDEKYSSLLSYLESLGTVAIAFSGGVDSTFLLAAAQQALGDSVVAITADSRVFPHRELTEAQDFCRSRGIRQIILPVNEMETEGFASNPPDRCYHCKRHLFSRLIETAHQEGIALVAEGSNMDDLSDYRPGMKAIKELGVLSPLRQAQLTKADIRRLSQAMGLPTWDKPSFACLASRIPYGDAITEDKLAIIDAAEQFLLDRGFRQVRVRMHGNIARIEVPEDDLERIVVPATRTAIVEELQALGFTYVTLDLRGYRTGSMNLDLVES